MDYINAQVTQCFNSMCWRMPILIYFLIKSVAVDSFIISDCFISGALLENSEIYTRVAREESFIDLSNG